jgi:hypothetical protein
MKKTVREKGGLIHENPMEKDAVVGLGAGIAA